MSHIVKIQAKITDETAVLSAAEAMGLEHPHYEKDVKVYQARKTGLCVDLPGWTYPIVIDLATGDVSYDNYNGHWGKISELEKFTQAYAVEKVKLDAYANSFMVEETVVEEGEYAGWTELMLESYV